MICFYKGCGGEFEKYWSIRFDQIVLWKKNDILLTYNLVDLLARGPPGI